MIIFDEIFSDVNKVLIDGLPDHLVYHNLEHTHYVLEKSILIAQHERINGHDLTLIKIAALYHDIGFIKTKDNHEETGCAIAQDDLGQYGISNEDIEKICGMIMATQIPQRPATALEKILADADLEYLGTKNFETISERLYDELKHFNPNLSRTEWFKIQIDFITAHQYHTKYCKEHRALMKQKNLETIIREFNSLVSEHK